MSNVVWNPGALHNLLQGPNGPVARDLAKRAIRVETAAKLLTNESWPPASVQGMAPHKRTGRLQSSITWRLGEDSLGLYAVIGATAEYAGYLEVDLDRPFMLPALQAAR